MRSEIIRVTAFAWVRIVNPKPFSILEQTYAYGDVLLIRPGGLIRPIYRGRPRVLASYQAPHTPYDRVTCPSDALLFATHEDLRLTAEGKNGYMTPTDPDLPTGMAPAPAPPCRILPGQTARIPVSRRARVMPPQIVKEMKVGGPFREEMTYVVEQRPSAFYRLRPGGVLTAMRHQDAHVCVRYDPTPDFEGAQCPAAAWFWMRAVDFIAMEIRYQTLRMLEAAEREEISRLMRDL